MDDNPLGWYDTVLMIFINTTLEEVCNAYAQKEEINKFENKNTVQMDTVSVYNMAHELPYYFESHLVCVQSSKEGIGCYIPHQFEYEHVFY